MKKYILLLIMALTLVSAHAEGYTYLNFVDNNAATTQLSAQGLKITFDGGNAIITAGGETTQIALSTLDYMEFTDTQHHEGTYATGDVDGSGIVDVDDVNAIINVILGNNAISDYKGNADVDGSGIVDVDDVNAVINIILSM